MALTALRNLWLSVANTPDPVLGTTGAGTVADPLAIKTADEAVLAALGATGDLIVGSRDSALVEANATLTRPNDATPYAVNGGMGTAATCQFKWTNFFRKNGNSGILTGSRLIASVASIATTNMGTVRLHLYNAVPTFTTTPFVDKAVWTSLVVNKAISLGYIEFSTWNIGGSGSDMITAYGVPPLNNLALKAAAGARDLYGYIIASSIFTPLNNTIIVPQLSMSED